MAVVQKQKRKKENNMLFYFCSENSVY